MSMPPNLKRYVTETKLFAETYIQRLLAISPFDAARASALYLAGKASVGPSTYARGGSLPPMTVHVTEVQFSKGDVPAGAFVLEVTITRSPLDEL